MDVDQLQAPCQVTLLVWTLLHLVVELVGVWLSVTALAGLSFYTFV